MMVHGHSLIDEVFYGQPRVLILSIHTIFVIFSFSFFVDFRLIPTKTKVEKKTLKKSYNKTRT